MDFKSMKRKELQALCKKHNIPANTTNAQMAETLSSLLQNLENHNRKGCLKGSGGGSGGNSGSSQGPKRVTFILEEEVEFEEIAKIPDKKSSRRRPIMAPAPVPETTSEPCEEVGKGGNFESLDAPIRTTRSRSVANRVLWSPVVEKKKSGKRMEGVRQNAEELPRNPGVKSLPEKQRSSRRRSVMVREPIPTDGEMEKGGVSESLDVPVRTTRSRAVANRVLWSPVVEKKERKQMKGVDQNGEELPRNLDGKSLPEKRMSSVAASRPSKKGKESEEHVSIDSPEKVSQVSVRITRSRSVAPDVVLSPVLVKKKATRGMRGAKQPPGVRLLAEDGTKEVVKDSSDEGPALKSSRNRVVAMVGGNTGLLRNRKRSRTQTGRCTHKRGDDDVWGALSKEEVSNNQKLGKDEMRTLRKQPRAAVSEGDLSSQEWSEKENSCEAAPQRRSSRNLGKNKDSSGCVELGANQAGHGAVSKKARKEATENFLHEPKLVDAGVQVKQVNKRIPRQPVARSRCQKSDKRPSTAAAAAVNATTLKKKLEKLKGTCAVKTEGSANIDVTIKPTRKRTCSSFVGLRSGNAEIEGNVNVDEINFFEVEESSLVVQSNTDANGLSQVGIMHDDVGFGSHLKEKKAGLLGKTKEHIDSCVTDFSVASEIGETNGGLGCLIVLAGEDMKHNRSCADKKTTTLTEDTPGNEDDKERNEAISLKSPPLSCRTSVAKASCDADREVADLQEASCDASKKSSSIHSSDDQNDLIKNDAESHVITRETMPGAQSANEECEVRESKNDLTQMTDALDSDGGKEMNEAAGSSSPLLSSKDLSLISVAKASCDADHEAPDLQEGFCDVSRLSSFIHSTDDQNELIKIVTVSHILTMETMPGTELTSDECEVKKFKENATQMTGDAQDNKDDKERNEATRLSSPPLSCRHSEDISLTSVSKASCDADHEVPDLTEGFCDASKISSPIHSNDDQNELIKKNMENHRITVETMPGEHEVNEFKETPTLCSGSQACNLALKAVEEAFASACLPLAEVDGVQTGVDENEGDKKVEMGQFSPCGSPAVSFCAGGQEHEHGIAVFLEQIPASGFVAAGCGSPDNIEQSDSIHRSVKDRSKYLLDKVLGNNEGNSEDWDLLDSKLEKDLLQTPVGCNKTDGQTNAVENPLENTEFSPSKLVEGSCATQVKSYVNHSAEADSNKFGSKMYNQEARFQDVDNQVAVDVPRADDSTKSVDAILFKDGKNHFEASQHTEFRNVAKQAEIHIAHETGPHINDWSSAYANENPVANTVSVGSLNLQVESRHEVAFCGASQDTTLDSKVKPRDLFSISSLTEASTGDCNPNLGEAFVEECKESFTSCNILVGTEKVGASNSSSGTDDWIETTMIQTLVTDTQVSDPLPDDQMQELGTELHTENLELEGGFNVLITVSHHKQENLTMENVASCGEFSLSKVANLSRVNMESPSAGPDSLGANDLVEVEGNSPDALKDKLYEVEKGLIPLPVDCNQHKDEAKVHVESHHVLDVESIASTIVASETIGDLVRAVSDQLPKKTNKTGNEYVGQFSEPQRVSRKELRNSVVRTAQSVPKTYKVGDIPNILPLTVGTGILNNEFERSLQQADEIVDGIGILRPLDCEINNEVKGPPVREKEIGAPLNDFDAGSIQEQKEHFALHGAGYLRKELEVVHTVSRLSLETPKHEDSAPRQEKTAPSQRIVSSENITKELVLKEEILFSKGLTLTHSQGTKSADFFQKLDFESYDGKEIVQKVESNLNWHIHEEIEREDATPVLVEFNKEEPMEASIDCKSPSEVFISSEKSLPLSASRNTCLLPDDPVGCKDEAEASTGNCSGTVIEEKSFQQAINSEEKPEKDAEVEHCVEHTTKLHVLQDTGASLGFDHKNAISFEMSQDREASNCLENEERLLTTQPLPIDLQDQIGININEDFETGATDLGTPVRIEVLLNKDCIGVAGMDSTSNVHKEVEIEVGAGDSVECKDDSEMGADDPAEGKDEGEASKGNSSGTGTEEKSFQQVTNSEEKREKEVEVVEECLDHTAMLHVLQDTEASIDADHENAMSYEMLQDREACCEYEEGLLMTQHLPINLQGEIVINNKVDSEIGVADLVTSGEINVLLNKDCVGIVGKDSTSKVHREEVIGIETEFNDKCNSFKEPIVSSLMESKFEEAWVAPDVPLTFSEDQFCMDSRVPMFVNDTVDVDQQESRLHEGNLGNAEIGDLELNAPEQNKAVGEEEEIEDMVLIKISDVKSKHATPYESEKPSQAVVASSISRKYFVGIKCQVPGLSYEEESLVLDTVMDKVKERYSLNSCMEGDIIQEPVVTANERECRLDGSKPEETISGESRLEKAETMTGSSVTKSGKPDFGMCLENSNIEVAEQPAYGELTCEGSSLMKTGPSASDEFASSEVSSVAIEQGVSEVEKTERLEISIATQHILAEDDQKIFEDLTKPSRTGNYEVNRRAVPDHMEELSHRLINFSITSAQKGSKGGVPRTPTNSVRSFRGHSAADGTAGKENALVMKMDPSRKHDVEKPAVANSARRPLQSIMRNKDEN